MITWKIHDGTIVRAIRDLISVKLPGKEGYGYESVTIKQGDIVVIYRDLDAYTEPAGIHPIHGIVDMTFPSITEKRLPSITFGEGQFEVLSGGAV